MKFSQPTVDASSEKSESGEGALNLRPRKLRASKFVKFGSIDISNTRCRNFNFSNFTFTEGDGTQQSTADKTTPIRLGSRKVRRSIRVKNASAEEQGTVNSHLAVRDGL